MHRLMTAAAIAVIFGTSGMAMAEPRHEAPSVGAHVGPVHGSIGVRGDRREEHRGPSIGAHVGPIGGGVGIRGGERREHRQFRHGQRFEALPYGVYEGDPCWNQIGPFWVFECD